MENGDSVQFEDLSDRFALSSARCAEAAAHQYYRIYRARLAALKPRLLAAVQDERVTWPVRALAELKEGEKCVVVGTMVKRQRLRPSVLKQLADEQGVALSTSTVGRYAGDDDSLELADEQQSAKLAGDAPVAQMVTGVVVAACGAPAANGDFVVQKILLPKMDAVPRVHVVPERDVYVCLVSGLQLGGPAADDAPSLMAGHLLAQYLSGQVGQGGGEPWAGSVARVIVAGDSFAAGAAANGAHSGSPVRHAIGRRNELPPAAPAEHVDHFAANLCAALPVDLMPGGRDPTSHMWPQRPMHTCLFPRAAEFQGKLRLCANPYACSLAGRVLLGTSGANVADAMANSDAEGDALLALGRLLRWQHLCPTAPDTIDALPCAADPFAMGGRLSRPDVLFAGNQPQLASELVEHADGGRTLLLCVPQFAQCRTAVLVNLRDLSVTPLVCSVDVDAVGA